MSTEFLSYKEAAYYLNLPIGTVYALVSQKRIPHVRLGNRLVRFSKEELRKWVASNSIGPKES